jgi:hypothetical protein
MPVTAKRATTLNGGIYTGLRSVQGGKKTGPYFYEYLMHKAFYRYKVTKDSLCHCALQHHMPYTCHAYIAVDLYFH